MLNEDPGTTATESSSPLDEVWVSIDLETTGLSPEGDEIIEVGAVKFAGERILDEFETFVNPGRRLSEFIRRYTGITQDDVDRAPPFSAVAPKLGAFIGSAPILGHNVAFDLNFLASKGLKLPNPRGDTWDLAYVLLPEAPEYALSKLAASLGVAHPRPHRAMEDAQVTREVFLRLTESALGLNVYTLAQIQQLAARSSWTLSYFLGKLEAHKLRAGSALGARREPDGETSRHPGVLGFDTRVLRERLQREKSLRANQVLSRMDVDLVASLLADGGPLSRTMPGFEERAEQVEMARSVAEAINGEQRLIVEAGTGVGKSLAYLLPAAMYAIANNKRVVVSTNTINLQEQLLKKDVPLLLEALAAAGIPVEAFRFTQLKGRANYLCLRRWSHLASSESLSGDEARVLSKVLVWLESTSTGDRAELNLAHRSASSPWDRVSTQGALDCAGANGVCFLRAARERAAAAHLVIVNHALLMSDVTAGGTLIPSYDILIVDEAHHLEAEATRHLGFQLSQASADERLQAIGGDRGLLQDAIAAFRGSSASSGRQESVTKVATDMMAAVPSIRTSISELFAAIAGAVTGEDGRGLDAGQDVRITKATRSQPAWSSVEIAWENVDVSLGYLGSQLSALETSLDGLEESGLIDYEGLMLEIGTALDLNSELRQHLSELIPHPSEDGIYWASRMGRTGDMSLHSAPLHVGALLDQNLFTQKQSVILTSATLSTGGSFDPHPRPDRVRRRQGAAGWVTLRLRQGGSGVRARGHAGAELVGIPGGARSGDLRRRPGRRWPHDGALYVQGVPSGDGADRSRQPAGPRDPGSGPGDRRDTRPAGADIRRQSELGHPRNIQLLGGGGPRGRRPECASRGQAALQCSNRSGVRGTIGAFRELVQGIRSAPGDPSTPSGVRPSHPDQDRQGCGRDPRQARGFAQLREGVPQLAAAGRGEPVRHARSRGQNPWLAQRRLMLIATGQPLDLQSTLASGQTFRWRQSDGWFEGVVFSNLVRVRRAPEGIEFVSEPDDEERIEPLLQSYFRLEEDLEAIYAAIDVDERLRASVERYRGMRLLRQDPWECLVSFICSSASNIPRISGVVEGLSAQFGRPIRSNGRVRGAFPGPDRLAEAGEVRLRELGLGFRARYVAQTARAVADGAVDLFGLRESSYDDALAALTTLPGVGDKVANCVLMFSLEKLDAFPVDVWIRRALHDWYLKMEDGPRSARDMRVWAQDYFGPYAGYANHYLFHDRRMIGRGVAGR